ncbi:zinc-ribbon and DUF3426 domain-containing protein [Variovorax sp. ZT4R33]|uniref:zinc-ribbon and DUF3426 domain-containing protein n=1 Tax=Variovorax sp. ZT4R33 TaxID=3443743 RepID=UPI003F45A134
MSLATRCPECGTTFKVVRDQLRISDGWVRCGRCSHVFDGNEHLHDRDVSAPEQPSPPVPEPAPPGPVDETSPTAIPVAAAPAPGPPHSAAAPLADTDFFSDTLLRLQVDAPTPGGFGAEAVAPPSVITDHIPQPPRTQPVTLEAPPLGWPAFSGYATTSTVPVIEFPGDEHPVPSAIGMQAVDAWSRLPSLHLGNIPRRVEAVAAGADADGSHADDAQLQKALRRARVKSAKIAKARAKAKDSEPAAIVLTASEAVEPAPAVPDAMSDASSRRARRELDVPPRRGFRPGWAWTMVSIAALLLLAGQVVYQERSAIVARQPSWRPAFASACEVLGCQLSALQRIADITIDGASFAREKGGEGYQLSFTLRNRADVPLAMPAVELSLIDLQERTVVRRVLRPADYGAPAVLAAHAERTALLPMALAGGDAAALPRVAGFHLDAFYP